MKLKHFFKKKYKLTSLLLLLSFAAIIFSEIDCEPDPFSQSLEPIEQVIALEVENVTATQLVKKLEKPLYCCQYEKGLE